MNERIEELSDQARQCCRAQQCVDNAFLEKFAELIVRECAQFVEDKFDFCGDEIIIAEEVKKYFGVEE